MDLQVESQAFKDLLATLKPQQSIAILLPENVSRDGMAASLALYVSLTQAEKSVKIACPKPPTVGLSHLIGINKVIQNLGNKNFVISLDYVEGSIEKVSYNIEGNKFNLVIEPRPGTQMFSEKNVHYNYSGVQAEVIVAINAPTLESLGKYYTENKQLFAEKPLVVIDSNPNNKQYGKINIVRPAAATSEVIAELIRTIELPISSDIATNLYDGLVVGSRNYSLPVVNAHTFEMAAWLLHNGARKAVAMPTPQEELPRREFGIKSTDDQQLPPDWLKPKIYKGSSLL